MRVFVGIDLGSTTTKAVILDDQSKVVGRGITNSRSNYDVASQIARQEAFVQARFKLTRDALSADSELSGTEDMFLPLLDRKFRLSHHLEELARLANELHKAADGPRHADYSDSLREVGKRQLR